MRRNLPRRRLGIDRLYAKQHDTRALHSFRARGGLDAHSLGTREAEAVDCQSIASYRIPMRLARD